MFSIFSASSMFSTCSELTPRAPSPAGRLERFMHPCIQISSWSASGVFIVLRLSPFSLFWISETEAFSIKHRCQVDWKYWVFDFELLKKHSWKVLINFQGCSSLFQVSNVSNLNILWQICQSIENVIFGKKYGQYLKISHSILRSLGIFGFVCEEQTRD